MDALSGAKRRSPITGNVYNFRLEVIRALRRDVPLSTLRQDAMDFKQLNRYALDLIEAQIVAAALLGGAD